ncbi:MAG: hypothetical protein AAGN66_03635 [Acidobacteriota bacterium]
MVRRACTLLPSPQGPTALPALLLVAALSLVGLSAAAATPPEPGSGGGPPTLLHPVLFVTQFPIAADFATIGSTFANHGSAMQSAGRGGDLYIRYPDGTLRNLTQEAGFGAAGTFQGAGAIAVRDPHVHWDGTRALFSMVVGAPTQQYQVIEVYWQIYEVTGLGQGQVAAITHVANQPPDFNNVTPIYSPDGRIVFTSDRPRDGRRHLYPQHDEYESTATNTGLWALDPASGALQMLQHSPSGSFTPTVDSYGRILFTRWDHLQQDQQADTPGNPYGNFDWASEEPGAAIQAPQDIFPEPRNAQAGSNVNGLRFNHFSPWQIFPDGTEEETLNHIGRHELHNYFNQSFSDDPNLIEFIASVSGRFNPNPILNFFQVKEDPSSPGTYFGVDAPEFQTHSGGMVARLTAPPTQAADQIAVTYVTHPDTRTVVGDGDPVPATHSGHYRDPLPLSGGGLLASHTAEARAAGNDGSRPMPQPRYDFQIKWLTPDGPHLTATASLVSGGISRQIEYWDPDVLVSYDGPMWELQPVEVRPRPTPPVLTAVLKAPEAQIFAEEGVDPEVFRADLRARGLALAVSRDVTTRDALDLQQPFNLAVPGGTQTTGAGGVTYDVRYLQFFQADQVRGIGGSASPRPGRRPLARVMHDPAVVNPPTSGPGGSVEVAADGSMAAFVPTRRAMSWQLTDPQGEPVVRERYWITFQPGEIRVCASCHGLNSADQAGQTEPENPPEALRQLLTFWKTLQGSIFADGFESGDLTAWSGGG